MASIRDEGVCVRHWDFSETSQTVSLLTRDHGLLRGLAKGARREKGAFSGGIELLTRGEVVAIVKSSSMATLTAWDLQETFPGVRSSLGSFHAGMYMADLCGQLLREGDPHPGAFEGLIGALRSLRGEGASDPALLVFQWSLLAECGYEPELTRDVRRGTALGAAPTYAFAPGLGGLITDADAGGVHAWRVRSETVELLRATARSGPPGSSPAEAIGRANRLLATYVREILGKEPPSMGVLFDERVGGRPE